jgi:glycosyltransferase involved in cell wall biosynthesis
MDHLVNDSPRCGFFAERHLGIGSAASAIEPYVRRQLKNDCDWVDVTYSQPGFLQRLPLPRQIVGAACGFLQTRTALSKGNLEALAFLTHNPAVLHQVAITQTPTLLWTDVTPSLLDKLAREYGHHVDLAWPVRALKRTLVRRTFHRAALCVGWSEWARRSFVTDYGVPEVQTKVVPPGIDLSQWRAPKRDVSQGRARFLFVGGDFVRKGGNLLLDVFRLRLRGRAELDLVTRDEVPEEEGVRVHRGLAAGSAQLMTLYRTATGFVLPTRADCFSIASLEAMAMGLPVVVSGTGGIPEIVKPGRTGYLVRPDDGNDLGKALEALLADPMRCTAMGLEARAHVEDRFDARKIADGLMALLATIARPRSDQLAGRLEQTS